ERMNTPLESCKTEVERYIVPLPNRADILQKEFGLDDFDDDLCDSLDDILGQPTYGIHLIFDIHDFALLEEEIKWARAVREEIKKDFIKDHSRSLPNEQELTLYLAQKFYNDNIF